MTNDRPNVLIEDWLPIDALGAESKRERGAPSALPPLYFLHVWWARRPLTVSRAAILASVLPQWSDDWPDHLRKRFPTEDKYHDWFIHLLGIRGDPVRGRQLIDWAKSKGIRLKEHPYGGAPRAYTVNPETEDLKLMGELLEHTWGTSELSMLDPFAGGGSIPFEALRYGFKTFANDLNPVAAVILQATLDYPARFGPSLTEDIQKWGAIWAQRVEEELARYFPKQRNENIFAYLWARTVACPTTGKPVPLSPNWWLEKGRNPVAVKLVTAPNMDKPEFEIVEGKAAKEADPSNGTVSWGTGRSPWTGEPIPSDYIKEEAQAGRMSQMLYAIVSKKPGGGFAFRTPKANDLIAVEQAESRLEAVLSKWISQDLIPSESFPRGNDNRPLKYGMPSWSDFFAPRQLLATGTYVQIARELDTDLRREVEPAKADAIATYLGMIVNKCINYNCLLSSWHVSRGVVRSVFDRHDFSFKWSFAEFDGARNLLPWAVDQIVDAYEGIAGLIAPAQRSLIEMRDFNVVENLKILQESATDVQGIRDGTIHNVTVDPPYYDNVQYAELSDFFFVWLKKSVGHIYPDFLSAELTNKDDEAVANPARFEGVGKRKKRQQLATQDYRRKMAAAFREIFRVLHPQGTLAIMFTHAEVEAWDTLAAAVISAGFNVKASWPVHTESEHSLHQAKKNAAASTILLVCRKRQQIENEPVWWDDIQGRVRQTAREKAAEYAEQGIGGVDLYISTFGPTLSIISERWPVLTSEVDPKTGEPKTLRPETALDLAREEVIRLRKAGLLAGKPIEFDPVTDWYLMAWDAFQAAQFPFDEARKLAITLGLEIDYLRKNKKIVRKKGKYVVLQQPKQRRKRGVVDPEVAIFEHTIDALHTAMLIYEEDGAGACEVFLRNRGLKNDTTFKAGLQALINAIPRTKIKGKFARPEADVLDRMRLAFYAEEIEAPPEEEPVPEAVQPGLFGEDD